MRSLVKSLLGRFGYVVTRTPEPAAREGLSRTMGDVLAHLSGLGLRPGTVIDVGVASGTPDLYRAFPDAFHVLIDPVEEFADGIQAILRTYRGHYTCAAATSAPGELVIHVHPEHLDGSSALHEQMGAAFDGVPRTVRAVTVDQVVAEAGGQGPYVLKVDVQGAELDVLEGAPRTLEQTELVLLEVSFFAFLKGSPQFYDVVAYMKEKGFVVYDIYAGFPRPLDGALGQCDLAFVREDGAFRRDHRYATGEQWSQENA